VKVQLSSAKKSRFKHELRLIGLLYEGQWRFYVTNIIDPAFTPQLIYELYGLRWQVEIFFNVLKHILNLDNIIARTKNGIMIEIYSALILHLLTRIVIALAAKKQGLSIHDFSFERSFKLVKGFVLANIHLFFTHSLQGLDAVFDRLVESVAEMGIRETISPIVALEQLLSP
jgi:IS4 transposase